MACRAADRAAAQARLPALHPRSRGGLHHRSANVPMFSASAINSAYPRPVRFRSILQHHALSIVRYVGASSRNTSASAYARAVVAALVEPQLKTGIPQWIVVDEAHEVFAEGLPSCGGVASGCRQHAAQSRIDPASWRVTCIGAMHAHVMRPDDGRSKSATSSPGLLQACGPDAVRAADALGRARTASCRSAARECGGCTRGRCSTRRNGSCVIGITADRYDDGRSMFPRSARSASLRLTEVGYVAAARNLREFVAAVKIGTASDARRVISSAATSRAGRVMSLATRSWLLGSGGSSSRHVPALLRHAKRLLIWYTIATSCSSADSARSMTSSASRSVSVTCCVATAQVRRSRMGMARRVPGIRTSRP